MMTIGKPIKTASSGKGGVSNKAMRYYSQVDDYYASESAGFWIGSASKKLGLEGEVQQQDFYAAMYGNVNGLQLRHHTVKSTSAERLAQDVTFSAPKSISIQAIVGGDNRLIELHEQAVRMAFTELEKHVTAIKKEEKTRKLVHTENLVAAAFTHTLARASKDSLPDPQLHTHCLIMNTTDRGNGDWGAITDNYFLYDKAREVGTQYRVFLANLLLENGYELRQSEHGFELAHISPDMIREFSKRNKEINHSMQERGLTESTPKQRDIGALATRENKEHFALSDLQKEWEKTISPFMKITELKQFNKPYSVANETSNAYLSSIDEKSHFAFESVKWAISHLEERNGLFTTNEIEAKALELSMYKGVSVDMIRLSMKKAISDGLILPEARTYRYDKTVLKKHPLFQVDKTDFEQAMTIESWIIHLSQTQKMTYKNISAQIEKDIESGILKAAEQRYASANVIKQEADILEMEFNGRHALLKPALSEKKAGRLLDNLNNGTLSVEQKKAALLMLTSRSRFIGIQGYAGTGKSHTFSAVKQALEQNSKFRIIGFAPKKSQTLALQELGMEAKTVALLLNSKKLQDSINKYDILLVDEAGTLSTKDTKMLMELAEKKNARLVFVGDTRQTHAVEAGKPFELLQENGMPTVTISEIRRQRNDFNRRAVQMAAEGNLSESFSQLKLGEATQIRKGGVDRTIYLNEIADENERLNAIADLYVPLSSEEKANTLILTSTNKERAELNNIIREKEGITNDICVQTLDSVDRTLHELRSSHSFHKRVNEEGQFVIEFFRDDKQGFLKNSGHYINRIDDKENKLLLQNSETGELKWLNLSKKANFTLYEKRQINLGAGDIIRITKNNNGLSNGDILKINDVLEGIAVTDKGILPIDELNHFTHAYAHSIYSSQGYTVNNVIVNLNTKSRATYDAAYYVAISRNRDKFYMFTDGDSEQIKKAISREAKKFNALDINSDSVIIQTDYQPTYGRKRFRDYFSTLPKWEASSGLNKAVELRKLLDEKQNKAKLTKKDTKKHNNKFKL